MAWPLLSSDTDTPLFLEIRADLAKSARNRRTPQREVAILAKKVRGYAASVNIDHYNMSVAELLGNRVEMRCRPLIGGARKGYHVRWSVRLFLRRTAGNPILEALN